MRDRYKIDEEIVATQRKKQIFKQEATQRVLSRIPQEKLYSAAATEPK